MRRVCWGHEYARGNPLDILFSGAIHDGKLEPGEEEGPASLSGV